MRHALGILAVALLSEVALAAPTQWKIADGGTGHYYEYIEAPMSWTAAKAAAEALTFGGKQGHLVTIASAGENAFVVSLAGAGDLRGWIGFTDAALPGTFAWITGEPVTYTNWDGNEPNNTGGIEDYVEIFKSGRWNDNTNNYYGNKGYVVEFDTAPPEFTPATAALCDTTVYLTTGDSWTADIEGGEVGDDLVISATGLPTGATLSPQTAPAEVGASSEFSWTPAFAQAGTHVVTLKLTGVAGEATCSITFDVTEAAVAPTFTKPATPASGSTFDHAALKTLTFDLQATDANTGAMIELVKVEGPGTLAPATQTDASPVTATYSWTPTLADAANNTHTIRFRATDDTGRTAEYVINVDVRGDSDGDGIPDAWETDGYTLGNETVDLPSMGADPNVKDVFVEIDYMGGADHTHRPLDAALDLIKQSFANRGIVLHVLVDEEIPHQDVLGENNGGYDWAEFDAIKAGHFSDAKSLAIHYCLFVHDIPGSTSGIARGAAASNFIVALGSFTSQVGTQAEQAGTFMHELGHDLGLKHGGGDDVNKKPNYLSVMNYMFQMTGVRKNGGYGVFDYSGAALPTLIEGSLDESAGIGSGDDVAGYGTHWFYNGVLKMTDSPESIDWNDNGSIETSASVDLNDDGLVVPFIVLTGHDDWANLNFKSGSVGTGVPLPPPPVTQIVEELTQTEQETLKPEGPTKVKGHVSKKKLHLTWKPSGLQKDGIFYRVYRKEHGSSNPDPVLLGETATTQFDDKTVQGGKTYTYYVTWVDAFGTESAGIEVTMELK
jgi:hypothetical protein